MSTHFFKGSFQGYGNPPPNSCPKLGMLYGTQSRWRTKGAVLIGAVRAGVIFGSHCENAQ